MTLRTDTNKNLLEDLGLTSPTDKVNMNAAQLLRLVREAKEEATKKTVRQLQLAVDTLQDIKLLCNDSAYGDDGIHYKCTVALDMIESLK